MSFPSKTRMPVWLRLSKEFRLLFRQNSVHKKVEDETVKKHAKQKQDQIYKRNVMNNGMYKI